MWVDIRIDLGGSTLVEGGDMFGKRVFESQLLLLFLQSVAHHANILLAFVVLQFIPLNERISNVILLPSLLSISSPAYPPPFPDVYNCRCVEGGRMKAFSMGCGSRDRAHPSQSLGAYMFVIM